MKNKIEITNKTFDNRIKQALKDLIIDFEKSENFNFSNGKTFEFVISTNFDGDFFNFSNEFSKRYFKQKGIPNHNAITILPEDENFSKFTVLFRNELFDSLEFYSTVFHELTHLKDYLNYFSENGNVYKGLPKYDEFFFWTEFNAKKKGIQRLLLELEKDESSISLEIATDNFINELSQTNNINHKLYLLMHFLARLSVFDKKGNLEFDDDVYPKKYIESVYSNQIEALYIILFEINEYKKFVDKRKEMQILIDKIREKASIQQ
jgi:hypothetical protein